jgi:hypothetical protein
VSLTSLLDESQSATRAFLLDAFPLVREAARSATWGVADRPTILPPPAAPEGLLGTAFDYRLRAAIAPFDPRTSFAAAGLLDLRPIRNPVGPRGPHGCSRSCHRRHVVTETVMHPRVFEELLEELAATPERGRDLDDLSFARATLLLALLESIYRSGIQPRRLILSRRTRVRTPAELLALVPEAWARDVIALVRRALAHVPLAEPLILNPTFAGSRDTGGADADLISGRTLVELKTRRHAEVKAVDLFQLLGYVLLDYPDEYAVRRVGIYLARQGWYREWSLDELAGEPLDRSMLVAFRRLFRAFLQGPTLHEPVPVPPLPPARRPGGPVRRVPSQPVPEHEAYRGAMLEAERAWAAARLAARAFEEQARPTWVYWRRDPALRAEREAIVAAAGERLSAAVAHARELDARVGELERGWLALAET